MSLSLYAPKDYTPEARKERRQAFGTQLATLYVLLDLRDNPSINLEQERTISRRFGKILILVANKVADMLEDGKELFTGFPYSAEQYRAAVSRLEDLAAAQERFDETSRRIGMEMRALRTDLGVAVVDALDTQDSIARNRTLDIGRRQRAEAIGAPVRTAMASRSEEVQRSRASTIALKGQVAEAEDLAAAAHAEAERLESELRTAAVPEGRAIDTPAPLAARTARRAERGTGEVPTPKKTPRDRRRKDR